MKSMFGQQKIPIFLGFFAKEKPPRNAPPTSSASTSNVWASPELHATWVLNEKNMGKPMVLTMVSGENQWKPWF